MSTEDGDLGGPESDSASASLSGFWTGVYDYPFGRDAVPFNAVLTETLGVLSGEIVEPNTFAHDPAMELFASLDGARDGAEVRFIKRYEAAPGAGHTVLYIGVANADLTKIEGEWTADGWSGPFVMNRSDSGKAATSEERIEAENDIRR